SVTVRACVLNSSTATSAPVPTSPFTNAFAPFLTAAVAPLVELMEPLSSSTSATRVSHCAPRSGFGVFVPIEKDVLWGEPSAFAQLSLLYSCTVTVGGLGVDPGSVTGLMYSVKLPAL